MNGGGMFDLRGEGCAEGDGQASTDDGEGSDEADGEIGEVHRTALAFGAAGCFAHEFGEEGLKPHAEGEGVAVTTIGTCDGVAASGLYVGGESDSDGFLTIGEMGGAADDIFDKEGLYLIFGGANGEHLTEHGVALRGG